MLLMAAASALGAVSAAVILIVAAIVTVADNGLAYTSVAEIAGPFWSGRALGAQNTGQFLAASVVGPAVGGADRLGRLPARVRARRALPGRGDPAGAARPGARRRARNRLPLDFKDAHRHRHDLPRLLRCARHLAARQGPAVRTHRAGRPRPPRLHPRPAPDRRRHALRRRSRDGDEAGTVGEALDGILGDGRADPVVIFPSPAGEVFTQATARELAQEQHLVFGCGRYEGIDQRVFDDTAARARVRLMSIGDYVLNGGEVATMAMIEAIGRLIPGVVGNPESLVQESHEDGLLEYPSYTKPAEWRGREVPPVLLSGNHGAIAAWRHEQQLERTASRASRTSSP